MRRWGGTADWGALLEYCRYSAMPVGRHVLALHGEDERTLRAVGRAVRGVAGAEPPAGLARRTWRRWTGATCRRTCWRRRGRGVGDLRRGAETPGLRRGVRRAAGPVRCAERAGGGVAGAGAGPAAAGGGGGDPGAVAAAGGTAAAGGSVGGAGEADAGGCGAGGGFGAGGGVLRGETWQGALPPCTPYQGGSASLDPPLGLVPRPRPSARLAPSPSGKGPGTAVQWGLPPGVGSGEATPPRRGPRAQPWPQPGPTMTAAKPPPLNADPQDLAEVEGIVRAAGTSFYRGMRGAAAGPPGGDVRGVRVLPHRGRHRRRGGRARGRSCSGWRHGARTRRGGGSGAGEAERAGDGAVPWCRRPVRFGLRGGGLRGGDRRDADATAEAVIVAPPLPDAGPVLRPGGLGGGAAVGARVRRRVGGGRRGGVLAGPRAAADQHPARRGGGRGARAAVPGAGMAGRRRGCRWTRPAALASPGPAPRVCRGGGAGARSTSRARTRRWRGATGGRCGRRG